MAGAKEVKTKIKSVQNTQKITKAMEMVAASKMRKAQERVEAARPYAAKIRRTVGHVARANIGGKHDFLVEREAKRVGIIVISTDRGLCGGLNINLFRRVLGEIRSWGEDNVDVDLATVAAGQIVSPGHRSAAPLRRETFRRRSADAGSCTGEKGDLAVEALHGISSTRCYRGPGRSA